MKDFASFAAPQTAGFADTNIEITQVPAFLPIDWLNLKPNLWMPGKVDLHRFWFERRVADGIDIAAKAYFEYET